jgi:hypothetical protein
MHHIEPDEKKGRLYASIKTERRQALYHTMQAKTPRKHRGVSIVGSV